MQTSRQYSLTWAIWALVAMGFQAHAAPQGAAPAAVPGELATVTGQPASQPGAAAAAPVPAPAARDVQTLHFNEGLAHIARGRLGRGIKLVDPAINDALARKDFVQAEQRLRRYADALANAGYLFAATEIYRRHDDVRKSMVTNDHGAELRALTEKFEAERRIRDLAQQKTENALSASRTETRRLRQKFARASVGFMAGFCAVVLWSLVRVRKSRERIRFNEEHDPLTGLHNRRYFNDHVLAREGKVPVTGCVLLADLDHFKRINETLGYPAGDAVLAAISHRLSAALGGEGTLVRWGGEEFLGVLKTGQETDVAALAERLLHAVRDKPVLWKDNAIQCTISVGFGCFPMAGAATEISLDSAISLVDKALDEAKQRGRDRACLIRHMQARNELDLTMIGADFQSAAADRRVQLAEILGAAA